MKQQGHEPKFLAGDDMRPLSSKILMPTLLILIGLLAATSSTTKPVGVALSGIIILLGILQFIAVGVVKPSDECLFYRRFRKWRRIEYSDIVKCGRPVFPLFWGLHYLRLRNFEPPLGRLYFALYQPAKFGSQYELDRALVEHIRERIPQGNLPLEALPPDGQDKSLGSLQLGVKACAISAFLAMLTVVVLRVLLNWPGSNFPPLLSPGQGVAYRALVYLSIFCMRLLDWPFNSIAIATLLTGIGALRFRGYAGPLSLILGAVLGGIAARWLGAI
ncbi:MAG TPA: hypothetical protein VFI45_12140 [Candidatus Acidoferrum sp.]|nr:hypothetical protein [Candidatus Acidoferrum sp.]